MPDSPPAPRFAPDPARAVLRITGPDRVKFLQGLLTNDMGRLNSGAMVYAALLSPQGKYLCDLFVAPDGDVLLVDAPADAAEDLLRRLTLYRLRAQVTVDATDLAAIRGTGTPPPGAHPDPRDPAMGWRLYAPPQAQGEPVDWDALAIEHRIPVHGTDLIPGDSFILEFGFARLNGVDFRKGCYVGQEVTARMHHKTDLRRGLVRLALGAPATPGTPVHAADGREAGRIGTVAGGRALALMRLDRMADGLTVDGTPASVIQD